MCSAIALAWSTLPTDLIGRHGLFRRVHESDGRREIRLFYRHREPLLPVWWGGQMEIVRWGNRRRWSRHLPRTGFTYQSSIDAGLWRGVDVERVDIPADFARHGRTWYPVGTGLRGLLAADERGRPVIYVVCEPASHYYYNMCKRRWMPMLIGERY